jgi:hypothetical protein
LVWTTYRRSYVTLPGEPWLADDELVALHSDCLARGLDLVLDLVRGNENMSTARRQTFLVEALAQFFRSDELSQAGGAAVYVKYHRDWLIRYCVPERDRHDKVLASFNRGITQDMSTKLTRRLIQGNSLGRAREQPALTEALASMISYTMRFSDKQAYFIDSFATSISFPPLFKALHGIANQLGISPIEEAFIYHMICTSLSASTVIE